MTINQGALAVEILQRLATPFEIPIRGNYLTLAEAEAIVKATLEEIRAEEDTTAAEYLGTHKRRLAQSLSMIPRAPHPNASCLDIGCYGFMPLWVKEHLGYARVEGIEMDPGRAPGASLRRIDAAGRSLEITVHNFDISDPNWPPLPSFDTVLFFETLEHSCSDPAGIMANVARLMTDTSMLVMSVPNAVSYKTFQEFLTGNPPWVYWFFHPDLKHEPRHCFEYTPFILLALLRSAGFTEESFRTIYAFTDPETLGDLFEIAGELSIQRRLFGEVLLVQARKTADKPPIRYPDCLYDASAYYSSTHPVLWPVLNRAVRGFIERRERTATEARNTVAAAEADREQEANHRRQAEADREQEANHRRQAEADRDEARRQATELIAQIEMIRSSTTWRITWPLRALGRRLPGLARVGRRAVRLMVYALRGELPQRLREFRSTRAVESSMRSEDLLRALGLPAPSNTIPDPASIVLPVTEAPRVTVIIPTYGHVDHTLRCLASIAGAPPMVPFEVLVVEDASGDPRVVELAKVEGLRLEQWPQNLGFLRSCNAAAKLARGELLFLLNNDTEVMPGAIDALAGLLDRRPDAGMVGARLLYPDGVLQEAGGIIWRDGSAWNYGNRDDPRKHQYNYVREVDYCSGAAIMLPRARWEEMAGFDEFFLPAYCEDSDLAFRLRSAGWKVLYQPRATVIHYEGVSHGTDTGTGIKAHQVENTRRLAARWANTLATEALPSGQHVMRARDRAVGRKIILVIDHYVPEPDRDAGSRTMLAFMEALVASGRVVKFLPVNLYRTPVYSDALENLGIEVLHDPWTESLAVWISENGADVDEILVSRPEIAAKYLPILRQHCRAPIVFYGHDLHSARMRLEPGALQDSQRLEEAARMEALERNVWRLVDMVLYPSEEEAEAVRRMEPKANVRPIQAYALSAPKSRAETAPASSNIIFIGGFRHSPNVDAAVWLATEILPHIQRERADAKLIIAGSNPTRAVLALARPGVEVRGFVSDEELETIYAEARVALCPLRFGAGVKLKVVEAMHRGVPVVTTTVGAQGLPDLSALCDVADEAKSLAAATLRLLSDDRLWLERVSAQANYVRSRFSIESMRLAVTTALADAERSR